MIGLLASTIVTSAADSLNPIAITQQFVLQGLVKRPRHIWFYIISIGLTNLAGGFLAYFGLVAFIGNFFTRLINSHGQILFTLEMVLGIAFLIGVCYLIQNTKIESLKKEIHALQPEGQDVDKVSEAGLKITSVSPMSLTILGIGATISELTTALPYFAFLAILFNYRLSLIQVTFILVIYNIIYSMPLIILYLVYVKAQDKFDYLYMVIKTKITKWSNLLAPTVVGAIGLFLVFHSLSLLL
ncbi:MAG TPA: GAP family protein [Candidatus Pelethocola excrementipullorum]|nr:GAP family protein [Candidatus Pelethocola excrementipullorum]